MDFQTFLENEGQAALTGDEARNRFSGRVDLSRTAGIRVDRDLYSEADARGLSLSELLECDEFDPSPVSCPLDAFERQLALAGVQLGGKNPTTVEQFFQRASTLMPEFMLREIRRGRLCDRS